MGLAGEHGGQQVKRRQPVERATFSWKNADRNGTKEHNSLLIKTLGKNC
jgi:hypothetical protein